MLARLLARTLFGSEWALKRRCEPVPAGWVGRFARALWAYLQYENGSSVAWNAQFAGAPCFPHGMKSIFVSGAARIGKDCVIFQQVTIGSNTLIDSKGFGAPVIGDRCYIGAGAKIIGSVRIGDDVRIGANAIVTRDVPSRSVVVAGEQVVMPRPTVDNRFFTFEGGWRFWTDGRWQPVESPELLARLEGRDRPG